MSKTSRKPKAIGTFMRQTNGVLRGLKCELSRQRSLLHHLQQALPSQIRPHLVAAHVHDDTLVLFLDAPIWMTRMRFHAPDLLSHLPADGPKPIRTKLRIQPRIRTPYTKTIDRRMSSSAARTLQEAADGTADADLRQALQRLSRLAKKT